MISSPLVNRRGRTEADESWHSSLDRWVGGWVGGWIRRVAVYQVFVGGCVGGWVGVPGEGVEDVCDVLGGGLVNLVGEGFGP